MADLLAYSNGRFVPDQDLTLGVADAGFVFGTTATDFCRTYRRRLFRWPDHLARLRRDCEALGIPLPYPDPELTEAADRLIHQNTPLLPTAEAALVTFATPGPVAHLSRDGQAGPPTVGMHVVPLRTGRYQSFFTEGVKLAVVGTHPSDRLAPRSIKHRSRLHWWQASRLAGTAVPALLDEDGTPDTPIGAVLAVAGGTVYRPRPGAILDSVSVRVVAELCGRIGLKFDDADLDFRQLTDPATLTGRATELLLTGTGFGLAGVRQVEWRENRRTFTWPGPATTRLIEEWSSLVGLDIASQMLAGD